MAALWCRWVLRRSMRPYAVCAQRGMRSTMIDYTAILAADTARRAYAIERERQRQLLQLLERSHFWRMTARCTSPDPVSDAPQVVSQHNKPRPSSHLHAAAIVLCRQCGNVEAHTPV